MTVYFVRHGETQGNVEHFHQLPTTPLSDVGRSQAKLLGHRFKKIQVDRLVSSDFTRALQTAQAISAAVSLSVTHDVNLRERRNPQEITGKKYSDPSIKKIKQLIESHQRDPDYHYSDEENYFDLIDRANMFVDSLDTNSGEKIVAVTHGIVLRTIAAVMLFGSNINLDQLFAWYGPTKITNTGITKFEFLDNPYSGKRWHLLSWNDVAHLE